MPCTVATRHKSLTTVGYLPEVFIRLWIPSMVRIFSLLPVSSTGNVSQSFIDRVHHLRHTHSLGPSNQRTLLQTNSCLECQKWSPCKVKGVFSTSICVRKQTNGPADIDQGISTGSCNRCHVLSARLVHPGSLSITFFHRCLQHVKMTEWKGDITFTASCLDDRSKPCPVGFTIYHT